jgi:hypothetical protein
MGNRYVMARIRTIKPEFPQSESMGRVSRDARLLFIELWTICDDEGRARGASRMLASLLFPYDDDAPGLIDGWLNELEQERCIIRYEVDGTKYIQVTKWLEHQKIDRPSASRLPGPEGNSRALASPREPSPPDLGPRTMDHTEANASGAAAPVDEIRDTLWRQGLTWIAQQSDMDKSEVRSRLGKLCSQHGNGAVLEAVAAAQRDGVQFPLDWITKRLNGRANPRASPAKPNPERKPAAPAAGTPEWEAMMRANGALV